MPCKRRGWPAACRTLRGGWSNGGAGEPGNGKGVGPRIAVGDSGSVKLAKPLSGASAKFATYHRSEAHTLRVHAPETTTEPDVRPICRMHHLVWISHRDREVVGWC